MKQSELNSTSKFAQGVIVVLLALLAFQAIQSMKQKSVTIDEIMYIAAGYYHLKTGDFQMNMTNPPFIKLISALPLLTLDLGLPSIKESPRNWRLTRQWKYARDFLYDNTVDADKALLRARLPIVILSIILGIFVFIWSKALYGEKAGLFALFLYCFSPNILAHSRLATQDLGLAALMFISTYYFWRYMTLQTLKPLIFCGISFGLAILTKTTAFFLIPIFGIYGITRTLRGHDLRECVQNVLPNHGSFPSMCLRQLTTLVMAFLIIGLLGIITLNIGYAFQGSFEPISQNSNHPGLYKKLPVNNAMTRWLADTVLALPFPVPAPYLEGIKFQSNLVSSHAGNVYFAGTLYPTAPWYVLFAAMLIKTPLPVLILLIVSIMYLFIQRKSLEAEWLMAIFISVIMLVFTYLSTVNIAIRYVLPMYPFIFVLISRLCFVEFKNRKIANTLLLVLATWYVLSSISIHPHYLAYFNESIGGPKSGYQYLVDSNLDWGQDLKGLKQYMNEKGIERIKLGYFGSADASYYGINYDYLPSVGLAPKEPGQYWWYEINTDDKTRLEPQTGVIAVSATLLASSGWMNAKFSRSYEWLRSHTPIDNVGYSILIYNIQPEIPA